jgi:entry exclusion lipoprotein TrbK
MKLKSSVFIACFLALSGCEKQPEPFDVSKLDCQKAESVEAIADAENKAKAVAHCAKLKSRESKFKPSDDKEWSLN